MTASKTFKGSVESGEDDTWLFNVEPLGAFCEFSDVVERLALDLTFSDDVRGP